MNNSIWRVAKGPSPDQITDARIRDIILSTTSQAVANKSEYAVYFDELETALSGRSKADIHPKYLSSPGQGEVTKSLPMRATIPIERIREVRLLFTSSALEANGKEIFQFGDSITLQPRTRGTLKAPESMASLEKEFDFGFDADTRQDISEWGPRFAIQIALADREIARVAQLRRVSKPEAEGYLLAQARALTASVMARFPRAGLVPGKVFQKDIQDASAKRIVAEVIGVGATIRSIDLHDNGRLDITINHPGIPQSVKFAASPDTNPDIKLQERLDKQFSADRDPADGNRLLTSNLRYPEKAAVTADVRYLQQDPDVQAASVQFMQKVGEITGLIDITPRARLERQLKLTASLNISPEEDATGEFSADFSRMTESFSRLEFGIKAGDRTFGGKGAIVYPLLPRTAGRGMGIDIFSNADTIDRADALYGNLLRSPVDSTSGSATAGLTWSFDTLSHQQRFVTEQYTLRNRSRTRLLGKVDAGLRYRDVHLDGPPTALTGLDAGSTAGLIFNGTLVADYDNASAAGGEVVGRYLIENNFELASGFDALAGNENFLRGHLATGIRLLFDTGESPPFYLLHRWAIGWAGDDTPTYEYVGAGDPYFVRGLERDEFIGRRGIATQTEVGVNIQWLLGSLAGESNTDKEEKKGEGLGELSTTRRQAFQDLYLAVFADFGWMDSRLQDGISVSGSKNFRGYGIMLNVMNWSLWDSPASFSLGYAHSPQSETHQSGVAFSRIDYKF